jgi:transcriptional regulator with XRE-family HTH domain
MNDCKIAKNLIKLRTSKGLTQEEVAKSLSISNKTVSKWENGTSTPDLSLLVKLAEYFGVTTDMLLGLCDNNKENPADKISSLFTGADRGKASLIAFELAKNVIPAIYEKFCKTNFENDNCDIYPAYNDKHCRSEINATDIYDFVINSYDVNCAVMLLRNRADFAWLNDPEKQNKIAKVFKFLSSEGALSVLYFIHKESCSYNFTADYIAENTGLEVDRATEILDELCQISDCNQTTAHLSEGDMTVYEYPGDGLLLSVLSLVYERICGSKSYEYCLGGPNKMIGGK